MPNADAVLHSSAETHRSVVPKFPMSRLAPLVAAVVLTVCFALPAHAAGSTDISQTLDVQQGLAFPSRGTRAFGVVTALQIGTLGLTPDLRSTDPTQAPASVLPAVGILSS